jgi:DNA replication protein DnaC
MMSEEYWNKVFTVKQSDPVSWYEAYPRRSIENRLVLILLFILSRFRYKAIVENIQYHADRSIDQNQIMRLAEPSFIGRNENLLIKGSTGIGKSYLASAIGPQACIMGYRVMYASTPKLFAKIKRAKWDGPYIKEITRIERQQLLIWATLTSSLRCQEPGSIDGDHRRQARKNIPDHHFTVAR